MYSLSFEVLGISSTAGVFAVGKVTCEAEKRSIKL